MKAIKDMAVFSELLRNHVANNSVFISEIWAKDEGLYFKFQIMNPDTKQLGAFFDITLSYPSIQDGSCQLRSNT